MALIDLSLDGVKFANTDGFTRDYGTKKTAAQNGGSLTTTEFNENTARVYDNARPVLINENSSTGSVEYNANIAIMTQDVELELGPGAYIGVEINVKFVESATIIYTDETEGNNKTVTFDAGENARYIWAGTAWRQVVDNNTGYGICTTAAGTQTKTVIIPGYEHKAGAMFQVRFDNVNTYGSCSGQTYNILPDTAGVKLSVNGGTAYPLCIGHEPVGEGFNTAFEVFDIMFDGEVYQLKSGNTIYQGGNSTNGYYKKHRGGLIEQWLKVTCPGDSPSGGNGILPIPYSSNNFTPLCTTKSTYGFVSGLSVVNNKTVNLISTNSSNFYAAKTVDAYCTGY